MKKLLIGLIVTFIVYLTLNMLTIDAFGENYVYDFTEEEWTEFNLMSLCYSRELNIDAIAVKNQSLESWCAERYGSLDNLYGEKIK